MSDLVDLRQLEMVLRTELEEAERQLKGATPEQKAEAVRQFRQALHAFSELVVHGNAPEESRRT